MKRILSLTLITLLVISCLAGCGKKDRILYNCNLSKYVDLGEYKGLVVDTSSDEFAKYYQDVLDSDSQSYDITTEKTSGTVKNGDTANIDYVGKKDGVAFEGGTAKGYDLTIGSGTFIPGFEEGLIGKEIGSTVDLNLTFPESYSSEELAGADVVFTVKINSVEGTPPIEEMYEKVGFSSAEEYEKDVKKRAAKNLLLANVEKNSKVNKYPEEDISNIYSSLKDSIIKSNFSGDEKSFTDYLTNQMGKTEEEFKNEAIENQVKPLMDDQLIVYSILDKAGLEVTKADIDMEIKDIIKDIGDSSVTEQTVKDYYGEYYIEYLVASEKTLDYLYDNAKIK